ncbi:MAG: hypothetical protein NNA23_08160 [Nitrospira sp.]|nr:hypothetical protein [Nitrospira sp.]MCP9464636.1 hypothetical protein [Nitrospira sp.]
MNLSMGDEQPSTERPTIAIPLVARAITGFIIGGIVGAIQVWFWGHDLSFLWAAMAAGVTYMGTRVLLTDWLQLAGGKILLGAASGLLAAVVWWMLASRADEMFIRAAAAGICFGAAYAWSDHRKS